MKTLKILMLCSLLITHSDELFSQSKMDSLYIRKGEYENLKAQLETLKNKVDRESAISDKSFTSISNQIASSSTLISVFSALLGVIGIVGGIYISVVYNSTRNMFKKTKQIKKNTEELEIRINQISGETLSTFETNLKKLQETLKIAKEVNLASQGTMEIAQEMQQYKIDFSEMQMKILNDIETYRNVLQKIEDYIKLVGLDDIKKGIDELDSSESSN